MGIRGKVELKRIEDKSSRDVTFTRRRNGLMKKARELSVLCDVDVALFVFSSSSSSRSNRLYEFATGESMTEILIRYQDYKHADEAVRRSVREQTLWDSGQKLALDYRDVWTADELTHKILWKLNENKVQQSNITELCQLEKQIVSILQQVRCRKAQLMLGDVRALQEEIMAVKLNEMEQN